jgi:hypothetical protein
MYVSDISEIHIQACLFDVIAITPQSPGRHAETPIVVGRL